MNMEQAGQNQDRSMHWRSLLNDIVARRVEILRATPLYLARLPLCLWHASVAFLVALPTQPQLRYKTVAMSCAILFISINILSATNPFKLLWPGATFQQPAVEVRDYVQQYGLEKDSNKIVPMERALLKSDNLATDIIRLSHSINQPTNFKDVRPGSDYQGIDPLPNFGNAIRKVWVIKKQDIVIIDLRPSSLDRELVAFLLNAPVTEERRNAIIDQYFKALTASVLAMYNAPKAVEFRLEGKIAKRKGMQFDLTRRYQ